MTIKIDQKIKKIELVENVPVSVKPNVLEKIKSRPSEISGTTYKLKSPLTDHALYITINHVEVDGKNLPFEIFINSKSLEHQQWIITITRLISSIFRQHATYGLDISFIVSELRSVFDPNGGYQVKNRRIPSLVAEIGDIIETHLIKLGTIEDTRLELTKSSMTKFRECPSCNSIALIRMDGCDTCSICGFSKCG